MLGYCLAFIFCIIASYQHHELGYVKGLLQEAEVQLAQGLLSRNINRNIPIKSHNVIRNYVQNNDKADELVVETAGFTSVPGGEYLKRASAVLEFRAKQWTQALGPNEPCSLSGPRCNVGLLCVGPISYKRCLSPSTKEAECDGVYKLCQDGLVCVLEVCNEMRSVGETCDEGFPCKEGLLCIARTCMEPGGLDADCNDKTLPCDAEHYCKGGSCKSRQGLKKRCYMPYQCLKGLFCNKHSSVSFCEPKNVLGGACGCSEDCTEGLCKKGVCVAESSLRQLAYGESCSFHADAEEVCADGLVCSVYNDQPRCITTRDVKKPCKNNNDCEYGYTCEFGGCWKKLYRQDHCGLESRSKCGCGLECKKQGVWKCSLV